MNRLTNEQRLQIIEFYYQNQCSVRNVFRALRPIYGLHNRPSEQTINAIVTKFRTQFTLLDIKPTTRMRTVRIKKKKAESADNAESELMGIEGEEEIAVIVDSDEDKDDDNLENDGLIKAKKKTATSSSKPSTSKATTATKKTTSKTKTSTSKK